MERREMVDLDKREFGKAYSDAREINDNLSSLFNQIFNEVFIGVKDGEVDMKKICELTRKGQEAIGEMRYSIDMMAGYNERLGQEFDDYVMIAEDLFTDEEIR